MNNLGTISGATDGVQIVSGVVTNSGVIKSTGGDGVYFTGSPRATLMTYGTISAVGGWGVRVMGLDVVTNITNTGLITEGIGLWTNGDGSVTLNNSGSIKGEIDLMIKAIGHHVQGDKLAVALSNSGSLDHVTVWGPTPTLNLTNSGAIASLDESGWEVSAAIHNNKGSIGPVNLTAASPSGDGSLTVSLDNRATMGDTVLSGALGHADVTNEGIMASLHLTGISATLTNLGKISGVVEVDGPASLAARGTLASTIDNGTITISSDKLTIGSMTGTGMLFIKPKTTLDVTGSVDGPTLNFMAGSNETLKLEKTATLSSVIAGFGKGDTIDLVGVHETAASFAAGVLTVKNGNAGSVALSFTGNYALKNFVFASDYHGGTNVTWHS